MRRRFTIGLVLAALFTLGKTTSSSRSTPSRWKSSGWVRDSGS